MRSLSLSITLVLGFAALCTGQQEAGITLDELERMALEGNPSLRQVEARIEAASGRRRQAGLYPNPIVGYAADETTPAPIARDGQHGFFVQQRIVTGGKLGLARKVGEQEVERTTAVASAQRYRVLNAIRSLYYQGLGEQRLIEVRTELAALAGRAVQTTRELANVGQADLPDVLAIEIEAQRLELGLVQARNALDRTWRQIAALVNQPGMAPRRLLGQIDEIPDIEFETALARIIEESPELRAVEARRAATELQVRQARAAVIPDIFARAGAQYNRGLIDFNRPRTGGWQGAVTIGVSLPIFNRNQGAIAATRAEQRRAELEVGRTRLELQARLAAVFREYQDSRAAVERYREHMIPKAHQAYEMYLRTYRQMSAAYPQLLIAQRNLFQLQEDYVATLIDLWHRAVEIQGLLITTGIDAPGIMLGGRHELDPLLEEGAH
ncbi:MAG: TolC family protein [Bryobacteraceae bacterium]